VFLIIIPLYHNQFCLCTSVILSVMNCGNSDLAPRADHSSTGTPAGM